MPPRSSKKGKKGPKKKSSQYRDNKRSDADQTVSAKPRETFSEAISRQGFDQFLASEFPRTSRGETTFLSKDAPLPKFECFASSPTNSHGTQTTNFDERIIHGVAGFDKVSFPPLEAKGLRQLSKVTPPHSGSFLTLPRIQEMKNDVCASKGSCRPSKRGVQSSTPAVSPTPGLSASRSGLLLFQRSSRLLAGYIRMYQRRFLERDMRQSLHPRKSETVLHAMARRFVVIQELRKKLVMRELVQRSRSLKASKNAYNSVTQQLLKIFLMNELSVVATSRQTHSRNSESLARELWKKCVTKEFFQRWKSLKQSQQAHRKVIQEILKFSAMNELAEMSALRQAYHAKAETVVQELAKTFVMKEVVNRSRSLREAQEAHRGVIQEVLKLSVVNELSELSASRRAQVEKAETVVQELVRKFVMREVVQRSKSLKEFQQAHQGVLQELLKLALLNELCQTCSSPYNDEPKLLRLPRNKRHAKPVMSRQSMCCATVC